MFDRLSFQAHFLPTLALLTLVLLNPVLLNPVQPHFVLGQSPTDARPTVGLRVTEPEWVAIENATIVTEPGKVLESASLLIRQNTIVSVGPSIEIPAGAERIDCTGKLIYPGLIDGYGEVDVDAPARRGTEHWNKNILPRRSAASAISKLNSISSYRSQGIAVRLVGPKGAIVKGHSCLVMLDGSSQASLIDDDVAQHLQLTVPRVRRDSYPNSPMGAIALLRQTLSDSDWYTDLWETYDAKSGLPRPVENDDLERLASDRHQGWFIVDAPNERMALRAEQIANEFSLQIAIRGSGREYRDAHSIAKTGRPILVPINFPDAPNVSSESAANDVSLRELMHWRFAPSNPATLVAQGATICLTTDGLDSPKDLIKNIRVAVQRGLSADDALAAVTTNPARLFGIENIAGRILPGGLANLVITDGQLFDDDTNILETWVNGKRFQIEDSNQTSTDPLAGNWKTTLRLDGIEVPIELSLKKSNKKWEGQVALPGSDTSSSDTENENSDEKDSGKTQSAKLQKLTRAIDRLTAWVDLNDVDSRLPKGPARITIVTISPQAAESKQTVNLFSTLTLPSGQSMRVSWNTASAPTPTKIESNEANETQQDQSPDNDEAAQNDSDADSKSRDQHSPLDQIVVNYPLGGFGVTNPIATEPAVLFRDATVWTCGPDGILPKTDVLVISGKIDSVGSDIKPPKDCRIVDCRGKHISPGLIDCHSHMATDGGVNESGQAVTAEVRVGDFVDNSDINIYRQLAGGLTTSNILHGSANPIGGQNQVIKLRWGDGMDAMKFAEAPQGIKFALGENVKRSNRRETQTRYPASRMGVEQLFRDRFLAAQEYSLAHQRWRSGIREGLPPRRDLELETIAEIIDGKRWIHCHSYRQDEIVALLDLLDEFEITIGTLQHILEGYKVADRMREHGAMASAFSDWWAYKFEVYDAIPDNGAIMHDVGIVVSFNSDDRELARHLNTEAAKAVKYGGVPAEEALKFVTLNPAKQLRIDHRVGSIESGKDADLVVWSGPPLSTLTRCEQTWVDGREMFSIQQDQARRQRDRRWRNLLINSILDENFATTTGEENEVAEEERWLRYDEFCHGHDHDGHDDAHRGHNHQETLR